MLSLFHFHWEMPNLLLITHVASTYVCVFPGPCPVELIRQKNEATQAQANFLKHDWPLLERLI